MNERKKVGMITINYAGGDSEVIICTEEDMEVIGSIEEDNIYNYFQGEDGEYNEKVLKDVYLSPCGIEIIDFSMFEIVKLLTIRGC